MKIKTVFRKFNPLFWVLVIIPTFCSIIYFSFWASDMYVSESSFVVRSARSQNSLSSFGALLQGIGISRSQDDTYTVQTFIRSRNALDDLEKVLPLEQYYEKGDLFSRFAPFGINSKKENFYQYFLKQQTINLDPISGIATLSINAFSAEDAQKINSELLKLAEKLINHLNQRARKDSILFSQQAVKEAENQVNNSALALADYRVKNGIFDIKAQSEVQLELISKLQGELISLQTQLAQIKAISPDNPQVNTLQVREKSLREEIRKQIELMLGKGDSIAHQTAEYQRLILENTLAQQQLTAALTSLQNAKDEAERQQLYLEVISKPNLPDLALLPYRIYSIISTLIFGLILYGIFSLLGASIREHKN